MRVNAVAADWREKAKPIQPGSGYPAKEHCSQCGLCDTYYVAHVKDACAFLGKEARGRAIITSSFTPMMVHTPPHAFTGSKDAFTNE